VNASSLSFEFAFEEPNPGLVLLPLAARRALDVAGIALSLDAWQGLSLDERRLIAEAGAAGVVAVETVERLALRARPAPDRIGPRRDPEELPTELAQAVGPRLRDLTLAWPALTPFERYALAKLARSKKAAPEERAARLVRACDEILTTRLGHLTHLTPTGDAHMVDVSQKPATVRRGVARAFVRMKAETLAALVGGRTPKGDVLAVARVAGIQAAKRTPELIPLCHAVQLTGVEVALEPREDPPGVAILATARAFDRTGVEMEALVAAGAAALTLYDMLKAIDRGMSITDLEVVAKSGGRSGDFERKEPA
jgi:cyclic pyranopterin phosphate synthase